MVVAVVAVQEVTQHRIQVPVVAVHETIAGSVAKAEMAAPAL